MEADTDKDNMGQLELKCIATRTLLNVNMSELPCTAPGCNYQGTGAPYKAPKMPSRDAVQFLKSHREANHPLVYREGKIV